LYNQSLYNVLLRLGLASDRLVNLKLSGAMLTLFEHGLEAERLNLSTLIRNLMG